MEFETIFGIFVILMGIVMTVINIIIMLKINNKDICKDDTTLKNSNTGNLVLSILLLVIGIVFYIYGSKFKSESSRGGSAISMEFGG